MGLTVYLVPYRTICLQVIQHSKCQVVQGIQTTDLEYLQVDQACQEILQV